MYHFILIIHSIVCVLLVLLVLFQAGKTLGLGGLSGGGSSDAIMTGAGGNALLKKTTAVVAVVFLVTSLSLSIMSAKKPTSSIMDLMPPAPVMPADNGLGLPANNAAEVVKSTK